MVSACGHLLCSRICRSCDCICLLCCNKKSRMPAVFRTDQKKKTGSMILKSFFLLQLLGLLCWYWHGDFGYSTGVLLTFVSMSFVNCFLLFRRTGGILPQISSYNHFLSRLFDCFFQNYIEILLGNLAMEVIKYSIACLEDVTCAASGGSVLSTDF